MSKPAIFLNDAAQALGIERPVQVELRQGFPNQTTTASYIGVHGGSHRIIIYIGTMKRKKIGAWITVSTKTANSLWHELTHALQVERDFDGKSFKAFSFYHTDLCRRLNERGLAVDEFATLDLGQRVRAEREASKEHLGQVISPTFDVYMESPWEVEAFRNGDLLEEQPITFQTSRKTKAGAKPQ